MSARILQRRRFHFFRRLTKNCDKLSELARARGRLSREWGFAMRSSLAFVSAFVTLVLLGGSAAMAQAGATLSKRALLQQDRAECSKQVTRTQANLFLQCMMNREAARKAAAKAEAAAAKKKAADERAAKREKAEQDWKASEKTRVEFNEKRLELAKQTALKQADCKKQATEQKLHFLKRHRFIEDCLGK
jgi:hypothetical protein